jgi:hypothetical protein
MNKYCIFLQLNYFFIGRSLFFTFENKKTYNMTKKKGAVRGKKWVTKVCHHYFDNYRKNLPYNEKFPLVPILRKKNLNAK